MSGVDNVPYTLFEKSVFKEISEADFIDRLIFKTLQGANATKKTPYDASAAFQHLFDVALTQLTQLKAEVDDELAQDEALLATVQHTSKEGLESAQNDVEQLLQGLKETEGTFVNTLSRSMFAGGRIQSTQSHIQRAEAAAEVMDHFHDFCKIGVVRDEDGESYRTDPSVMDAALDRLCAAAKKRREAAIVAEQVWQEKREQRGPEAPKASSQQHTPEGEAEDGEASESAGEEELMAEVAELEGLPSVFCDVSHKCFLAQEVQKLLCLTSELKGKDQANGVNNVKKYANWLHNELIEDCFCYIDCYESFLGFLHRHSGSPPAVPGSTGAGAGCDTNGGPVPRSPRTALGRGSSSTAASTAHGQRLLERIRSIPDAVGLLGNVDALMSRYINMKTMELNTYLPTGTETTVQDVTRALDSMATKFEYESLLTKDVFHPTGFVMMHRLLSRFCAETLTQLIEGVLSREAPPVSMLTTSLRMEDAAEMAAANIGMVYSKDKHGRADKEEKQRLTLLTYNESCSHILQYLQCLCGLYRICQQFAQRVAAYVGGSPEWLVQQVDANFAAWRADHVQWEMHHLKMHCFYHVATAKADEDVSPYASYSTLVYLTTAASDAMDRCMLLSPPLQVAQQLNNVSLLLLEYSCTYIQVCVQACISNLQDAFRHKSHVAARVLDVDGTKACISTLQESLRHRAHADGAAVNGTMERLNASLAKDKPHIGCLYVVAWASQSIVKLDQHAKQKAEPLLKSLGATETMALSKAKDSLLQSAERKIAVALNLSCRLMVHNCLATLSAQQSKQDFKHVARKGEAPGGAGCSLAARHFEADVMECVAEINQHLEGPNHLLFAEAFAGMLFDGLCAHFRSYPVNGDGALVLRADISRYTECVEALQVSDVLERPCSVGGGGVPPLTPPPSLR